MTFIEQQILRIQSKLDRMFISLLFTILALGFTASLSMYRSYKLNEIKSEAILRGYATVDKVTKTFIWK